jgi:hypothetical protein
LCRLPATGPFAKSGVSIFLSASTRLLIHLVPSCRLSGSFSIPPPCSLRPLDIEFMKQVHKKVNLIPIISKADTLTEEEVAKFKQRVRFQGPTIYFGMQGLGSNAPDGPHGDLDLIAGCLRLTLPLLLILCRLTRTLHITGSRSSSAPLTKEMTWRPFATRQTCR